MFSKLNLDKGGEFLQSSGLLLGKSSSVGSGLGLELVNLLLRLEPGSSLHLTALLKTAHDIAILPANLARETAKDSELALRLETVNAESIGDDDTLGLVVGRGNSLEDLKTAEGGSTTRELVREHATNSTP